MTDIKAFEEPSHVEVVDGEVVIQGPGPIAASFTADAAEETAHKMLKAVVVARDQKRWPARAARRAGGKAPPDSAHPGEGRDPDHRTR